MKKGIVFFLCLRSDRIKESLKKNVLDSSPPHSILKWENSLMLQSEGSLCDFWLANCASQPSFLFISNTLSILKCLRIVRSRGVVWLKTEYDSNYQFWSGTLGEYFWEVNKYSQYWNIFSTSILFLHPFQVFTDTFQAGHIFLHIHRDM